MLRAAQVLLGIAAIGFLLMASKVAVVGPCTDTLGAFSIIAVVFGAPLGLVLLLWSITRMRRKKSLSEGLPPTDPV